MDLKFITESIRNLVGIEYLRNRHNVFVEENLICPIHSLTAEIDAFDVPAGWLVGPLTRKVDSWTPQLEMVRLQKLHLPRGELLISIINGASVLGRVVRQDHRTTLDQVLILDLRHDGNQNIAHALAWLGGLAIATRHALGQLDPSPTLKVVLRKSTASYVVEAFRFIGFDVVLTDEVVTGTIVLVREKGHNVGTRLGFDYYCNLPQVQNLRDRSSPAKLYIPRKGSREIINGDEISTALRKLGFYEVDFQRVPLYEQLKLVVNAKVVVAVHGAALGGLALRKTNFEPPQLIELFGPYVVTLYREIAALMNASWCGVQGHIDGRIYDRWRRGSSARDFQSGSFAMDPMSIEFALQVCANPLHVDSQVVTLER